MIRQSSRLRPAWQGAALDALPTFLLAVGLSLVFAFGLRGVPLEGRLEMLWPALGAALALSLRAGSRFLAPVVAALVVSAAVVFLTGGWPVPESVAFAAVLGGMLAAQVRLLRFWRLRPLLRPADVGLLAGACALVATVAYLPAAVVAERTTGIAGPHVAPLSWLIGSLWGVVCVAPLILTIASPRRWPWRQAPEFAAAALITAAAAYYNFALVVPGQPGLVGWPYLIIVGLAWLAVRLGVAAVAPVASLVAWFGSVQALIGEGAFSLGAADPMGRLLVAQLFFLVITVTTMLVAVLTDERGRQAQALADLALEDPVTGLPNRRALQERLTEALARLRRRGAGVVAVLFCDLDQFKQVNDTLGHQVGDELLAEVARRFRAVARSTDSVSRIGGDEFVVVSEGLTGASDGLRLALRMQHSIRFPWTAAHHTFRPAMSVGVATTDDPNTSADDLLRHADLAMYEAKDAGRDCVRSYDRASAEGLEETVAMQHLLRTAVERDALLLHYQPIIDLTDDSVVGAEALIRLQSSGGQIIPPDRFIPLAETTGLITPIGAWALDRAFVDLHAGTGGRGGLISVNVSPAQLRHREFPQLLLDTAQRQRVAPASIMVEVTETALIQDNRRVASVLRELHDAGVTIALDDFGTGYSSLSWLTQFPVDLVKIDRTFTAHLGRDDRRTSVLTAVIAVARELSLDVIAEGVETQGQRDRLVDLGCPMAQGFLWGQPLPAGQVRWPGGQ